MLTQPPRIDSLDSEMIRLTDTVVVPRRFRAVFDDEWATTLEIEVADDQPMVRGFSMSTVDANLASRDLRPALRGVFLPAAMRAACKSVIFDTALSEGDSVPLRKMGRVPRNQLATLGKVRIGQIVAMAPMLSHADAYNRAAREVLPRGRGRPRREPDYRELEKIADVYNRSQSVSDVLAVVPMSRSTAGRRITEARTAGLIPPRP